MVKLSIIIVHYNTLDLTLRCLKHLLLKPEWELIIVDNNSQDGAKEHILGSYPHIKWVENKSNEGFGRANNLGVQFARGEYLLLLNSDMIVLQETIQSCLNFFDSHPKTGALGCLLRNEDGSIQKSTYAFIGENEEIWRYNLIADKIKHYTAPTAIRAVMGSFFMIKAIDFQTIDGFDPDYFMYCEELDFCDRISKELKKDIIYYKGAEAIHKHGGSSDGRWSSRQTWLSRALLVYKRKGILYYIGYHTLMTITIYSNLLVGRIVGKSFIKDWKKTVAAYRYNRKLYFQIPFKYSRKRGNGKNLLKVNQ